MKRLLFITAFPPNLRSGGQKFSLNALKDLKNHFAIDLIYFTYPGHKYDEIDGINVLRRESPSLLNCLNSPLFFPIFTKRFSKDILNYLQKIVSNYDVVFFDYMQTAIYSLFLNHNMKVIRCHDILAQKFFRERRALFPWIKNNEYRILKSANFIFTPSDKDSLLIKEYYHLSSDYTNEYLTPFSIPEKLKVNNDYVFLGLWSRPENLNGLIWFINNVIKQYKNELDSNFYVVGGGLPDSVYHNYLGPYGITYLGYQEDVYSELVKYKAVIAPLFKGAGIKVKVLDAFNTGTPVVGTDVAFEGIKDIEGLTFRGESASDFLKILKNMNGYDVNRKLYLQKVFTDYYYSRHLSELIVGLF